MLFMFTFQLNSICKQWWIRLNDPLKIFDSNVKCSSCQTNERNDDGLIFFLFLLSIDSNFSYSFDWNQKFVSRHFFEFENVKWKNHPQLIRDLLIEWQTKTRKSVGRQQIKFHWFSPSMLVELYAICIHTTHRSEMMFILICVNRGEKKNNS